MREAILTSLICSTVAVASAADSRVFVANTFNNGVIILNARTLAPEPESPLFSKGPGPVRMTVGEVNGNPYLFTANSGGGSVGVYDLGGDIVLELPLSPFPARPGPVGIAFGDMQVGSDSAPMVFVTNTVFALEPGYTGPGSVTAYSAEDLPLLLQEFATAPTTSAPKPPGPGKSRPWGVSADEAGGSIFVTNSLADMLDTFEVGKADGYGALPAALGYTLDHAGARATGSSPDGTVFDSLHGLHGLVYVADIGSHAVSVFSPAGGARMSCAIGDGTGPIDLALADARDWLLSSNGGNDTVGVLDRGCIATAFPSGPCSCVVATPATKPGGEPESVAYDPASDTIFAVNKSPMGQGSLSVLRVSGSNGPPSFDHSVVSLSSPVVGGNGVFPSFLPFEVVVQVR